MITKIKEFKMITESFDGGTNIVHIYIGSIDTYKKEIEDIKSKYDYDVDELISFNKNVTIYAQGPDSFFSWFDSNISNYGGAFVMFVDTLSLLDKNGVKNDAVMNWFMYQDELYVKTEKSMYSYDTWYNLVTSTILENKIINESKFFNKEFGTREERELSFTKDDIVTHFNNVLQRIYLTDFDFNFVLYVKLTDDLCQKYVNETNFKMNDPENDKLEYDILKASGILDELDIKYK